MIIGHKRGEKIFVTFSVSAFMLTQSAFAFDIGGIKPINPLDAKGGTYQEVVNQPSYVLKKGTLSRNATFLEFGKKLGIDYSVDYQPVELYVNGKYHGSYLLTEKVQVKKNRVDIDEKNYYLK